MHFMKKLTTKKPHLAILLVLTVIGLLAGVSLVLGITSLQTRRQYSAVEVTFISPQQAVLFWKTNEPGLGYAQWGTSRHNRDNRLSQTSSDPSEVHAVMFEDIPPGGVFVSLHTQEEPRFSLPKVYHVQYQEGSEGGPL